MYKCQTERKDIPCAFMEKKGCPFIKCGFEEIVPQCEGCEKVEKIKDISYCKSYLKPFEKWKVGFCNLASHIKKEKGKEQKINPLKASKRANKKK